MQQEDDPHKNEPFINIRKLAAIDMAFNGPTLILFEFIAGIILCLGPGITILSLIFFAHKSYPFWLLLLGFALTWVGINYIPLFIYAIDIFRHKSALTETAYERKHVEQYKRKYNIQQLWIFVPFAIVILTLIQERQRRSPQ